MPESGFLGDNGRCRIHERFDYVPGMPRRLLSESPRRLSVTSSRPFSR
jgi:hypothetical protein